EQFREVCFIWAISLKSTTIDFEFCLRSLDIFRIKEGRILGCERRKRARSHPKMRPSLIRKISRERRQNSKSMVVDLSEIAQIKQTSRNCSPRKEEKWTY
ncbi:MAG: hypothetical protein R6W69_01395, partial [Anaerolineales bacterium]